MLDACDVLRQQPTGEIISNPWDETGSLHDPDPTTPRLPSSVTNLNGLNGHDVHGRHESVNGSTSTLQSSPSGRSGLRSRRAGSHRRMVTEGSPSSHPLQSPTVTTNGSKVDATVTRPALRRVLSSSEGDADESEHSFFGGDTGTGEFDQRSGREAEVMVIVHEVKREDSLAGVALKYGITLADLRKVNHLWASDSIHLRKVLYVPLHLSSKRYHFFTPNGESSDNPVDEEDPGRPSSSTQSSVVIQRIPVSQLAFFPPPSQPTFSSPPMRKVTSLPSTPPRMHSESPGPGAFSSLLQSLPLPSRESLFSRLSLESGDAPPATSASETSSDYDHEMDILDPDRVHPRRRERRSRLRMQPSNLHRNSTASIETLRNGPDMAYDTPLVPLQTEQLKPSPRMELPRALKKDVG